MVDSISSVSTSVAAAAAAGPSVLLSEEHIASVETNDTHTLAVTSQRSLLSVNMGHQSSLKVRSVVTYCIVVSTYTRQNCSSLGFMHVSVTQCTCFNLSLTQ